MNEFRVPPRPPNRVAPIEPSITRPHHPERAPDICGSTGRLAVGAESKFERQSRRDKGRRGRGSRGGLNGVAGAARAAGRGGYTRRPGVLEEGELP